MTEHSAQCLVVAWARSKGIMIFAIPNGGARDAVSGAKLRDEGVKPGIPDLCIPYPRKGYGALYIEMKTLKGRVSPAQKEAIDGLRCAGNRCVISRSWEDACTEIDTYLALGDD